MIAEKPELNEDLLIHFGVKGMKWGRRRKRPDEAQRGKVFSKANGVKLAKGAAVVAGVALVAAVLTKSGRTKMVDVATTTFVQNRTAASTARANPVTNLVRRFKDVKASSLPSPASMMADAQRSGARTNFGREATQRLTERTWRDQARLTKMVRDQDLLNTKLLSANDQALANAYFQRYGFQ